MGRVFIFAVLIDAVYQIAIVRWLYPGEAMLVGALLALVPYLLARGTTIRLARRKRPDGRPS